MPALVDFIDLNLRHTEVDNVLGALAAIESASPSSRRLLDYIAHSLPALTVCEKRFISMETYSELGRKDHSTPPSRSSGPPLSLLPAEGSAAIQ